MIAFHVRKGTMLVGCFDAVISYKTLDVTFDIYGSGSMDAGVRIIVDSSWRLSNSWAATDLTAFITGEVYRQQLQQLRLDYLVGLE